MSLTGFVLAFAGALAAKVRPAPADRQRLARREQIAGAQLLNQVIADRDAAHWALETALGELDATREALGQARSERDALRDELEREWRARERMAQQVHAQAQMAQTQQMAQAQQMAQYQAQQNVYQSGMFGVQRLQGLGQAQAFHDCTCVPGRAAAFGRGPIDVA